jgi:hypothetical protein
VAAEAAGRDNQRKADMAASARRAAAEIGEALPPENAG